MNFSKTFFLSVAAFAALHGCGKESYVTTSTIQGQVAPGHFTVPPKVDIILAEDDTGSMKEAYGSIASQLPAFLSNIETKGWDYHFLTIPLTTDRAVTQATASHYDPNWGSAWVQPYPGAQPYYIQTLASNIFRYPTSASGSPFYTGFLSYENTGGSMENAFENMRVALNSRVDAGTSFSRPDALTVILVIGNGNDTSLVNYCDRGDGVAVECDKLGKPQCADLSYYSSNYSSNNCATGDLSLAYYKSQLQSHKPSPSQTRLYAAVAAGRGTCLGGAAFAGTRYQSMASITGGESFDICSQPISSVLSSLSNSLQATKLAFRMRYLFINQEPNVDTIQVTKYVGGVAGNAVGIPNDASNGWTYAGFVNNVYTIDYPMAMNLGSGYAIELHGSAKLVGDDTADVKFLPAGIQNSH